MTTFQDPAADATGVPDGLPAGPSPDGTDIAPVEPAQTAVATRDIALAFTGKGGEYFGIWVVNLALSVITLGIYSAWAKVRRMRYFHRNTLLDDQPFDYHAPPRAILIGRAIGLGFFALYNLIVKLHPYAAMGGVIVLYIVMPWMIERSMRFRFAQTSYRGLRFRFVPRGLERYAVFLGWPILATLTLGLLAPKAHRRLKIYQLGRISYGEQSGRSPFFLMKATTGQFARVYLVATLLMLVAMVGLVLGAVVLASGPLSRVTDMLAAPHAGKAVSPWVVLVPMLFVLVFWLASVLVGPYFTARIQNLVWNGAQMGPLTFSSRASARRLTWISLGNLVLTLLSLGLFRPYAVVRRTAYLIGSLSVTADGSLDEVHVGAVDNAGALGDATADLFSFDFGF